MNIVYFSLGIGKDIVYHGRTEFRGIHNNDLLELSKYQQQKFDVESVSQLYPEYYILKVNDFDRVATTPLDEWVSYLKTGDLPDSATAPGLEEVREKLKLDILTRDEFNRYQKQVLDAISDSNNLFHQVDEAEFNGHRRGLAEGMEKGLEEGVKKGLEEGIEKGRQEGILEVVKNMKSKGEFYKLVLFNFEF